MVGVGIELCLLQFQLLIELAVEVERLAGIKVDSDAVQLALKVDTVMVLHVVGIGRVTTGRQRFDVVVLLVFFQLLVLGVAQHHFCIYAGRVGTRLALGIEGDGVLLLSLLVEVGQKAELVEGVVLIEVVQLAGNLLPVQGDQRRAYLAIGSQRNNNRYIRARAVHRIGDTDGDGTGG